MEMLHIAYKRVGLKWRTATGVLCDKKVSVRLKGKFYRVAIRPALLYGTELAR